MYGIDLSLAYIKQNLKTHITTDKLAEIAGYSAWHFGRLFATATGRTFRLAGLMPPCRKWLWVQRPWMLHLITVLTRMQAFTRHLCVCMAFPLKNICNYMANGRLICYENMN